MLTKNKLLLLFTVVVSAAIVWLFCQHRAVSKTGYIIIQEVYNGFEMKKEMESKYLQTKNNRDKILDSLVLELKIIAQQINDEKEKNNSTIERFNSKREEYTQAKKRYEEDNAALTKQYDQQILAQLNQYMKEYGKSKHFAYVFGSDGNGSLIYGKESLNVTIDMIKFVNEKYKGL